MDSSDQAGSLSPVDLKVLAAMRHGLLTEVAGEVRSPMARTICDFSIAALDRLIARHGEWPRILAERVAAQAGIVGAAARLLHGQGVIGDDRNGQAVLLAERYATPAGLSLGELEAAQCELDAALGRLARPLMHARALGNPEANALFLSLASGVVTAQAELSEASQARVEAHSARAQSYVSVTAADFAAYLHRRFPDRTELALVAYDELPGGSSKTTVLAELRGFDHPGITPVVVRMDRVGGSTGTRATDEVPIVAAAHRLGFPVPEVLWCEEDATALGCAFYVVRKMGGVAAGGMMGAVGDDCSPEVALDLARILARLHAVDLAEFGLADPGEHPMNVALAQARKLLSDYQLDREGILECCLCWLEENMPPPPARPALVHGDVSAHNLLVSGTRVEALLDWELFHAGDPIEDLAISRSMIERMIPWEEFLAEYRRSGGTDYSDTTGNYYWVWSAVRNMIFTLMCRKAFYSGENPDLRWEYYASYYAPLLNSALARIAHAEGRPAAG